MLNREVTPQMSASHVHALRRAGFISAEVADEWFIQHLDLWVQCLHEIRNLPEVGIWKGKQTG